jgi:hypothetical protein
MAMPCFIGAPSGSPALLVILDEHIRLCRHLTDDALAIRVLQIDRDRPLRAVRGHVIGRFAVDLGRHPAARVVAAFRLLDLPHIRAEVGKRLRTPGAREHARQVEHFDCAERRIGHR